MRAAFLALPLDAPFRVIHRLSFSWHSSMVLSLRRRGRMHRPAGHFVRLSNIHDLGVLSKAKLRRGAKSRPAEYSRIRPRQPTRAHQRYSKLAA